MGKIGMRRIVAVVVVILLIALCRLCVETCRSAARWLSPAAARWRWRTTARPIRPVSRQSLQKPTSVKRGEYLARAADCVVCHTTPGGKPYAGGLAIRLPFGTLYSTNITPDKATGIGDYSDQDFLNAVQHGIRRDGARLYPAMPYPSYTYITDADALAIKAYLFSLPAVQSPNTPNTLTFPFDQRWAMAIWSAVFNANQRFEPNTAKSAEWNRGAYVAEALAHCGECHTPRNLAFALDNRRKFAGALTAGWRAFNISSDKGAGIGAWSDDELAAYLSTGHALDRGTASGPMGEAVDESFSQMAPVGHPSNGRLSCAACPRLPRPTCRPTIAPPAPASPKEAAPKRTSPASECLKAPA